MRLELAIIVFILFVVIQFFCTRKITHKIIRFSPMLLCVIAGILAIIGTFTTYQFLTTLLLIPIVLGFLGSLVGLLLGKLIK